MIIRALKGPPLPRFDCTFSDIFGNSNRQLETKFLLLLTTFLKIKLSFMFKFHCEILLHFTHITINLKVPFLSLKQA